MARVSGEERLTPSIKAAVPGERMLPGRLEMLLKRDWATATQAEQKM